MGYGRIDAISNFAVNVFLPKELNETQKVAAISLVQSETVKKDDSPFAAMGLDINGDNNGSDIHPKKAKVPKKSKNIPEAIPLNEVKILNAPASKETETDKIEAFSGSSYLVYNEDGSFKCSCREDGKLVLNKVPAYLGHLNPDNSFKYAFEKYSYDENGNCTRFTKFDTGGNVEYFTDYKYDEKGNKIQEIKYKSNGKVKSFVNYVYDDEEKQIACNYYNEKGNLTYCTNPESTPSFLPPKEGALLPEGIKFNSTILTQRLDKASEEYEFGDTKVLYDENGYAEKIYNNGRLLYDIIRFGGEEISICHKYEYNKDGKLVRENIYDGDGIPSTFWKYEYDEISGNRIKDIQYKKDGNPVTLYLHEYDKNNERTLTTQYDAVTGKKLAEYPGGEFFTEPGGY